MSMRSTESDPSPSRGPLLRRELRQLTALAVPIVAVQVGLMLMGAVDTMMVGRLSEDALAASALGSALSHGILWLLLGLLMALDPLVAQAFGAGDQTRISSAFQRGLVVAVAIAIPGTLAMIGMPLVLPFLGQEPRVVELATEYLGGLAPGVVAFTLFVAMRQTLQAMRIVRPTFIAMVVSNVVNALANYCLIFGNWGFPALGVQGSAYATSISRWCLAITLAVACWPQLRSLLTELSQGLGRLASYVPFVTIGAPISVMVSLEIWVFNAAGIFMGHFGAAQLAGHQVTLTLAALTFMVPQGIGGAAATRVGNAIGRRDLEASRRSALVALLLGATVMAIFGLVFWGLPFTLASIFTTAPAALSVAVLLLPVAALFQVADGLQVVAAGILRGAADTRVPAAVALVGYWILGLPIGWLLAFRWGVTVRGLWIGLTVGLSVVAVLLIARVVQTLRQLPAVTEDGIDDEELDA